MDVSELYKKYSGWEEEENQRTADRKKQPVSRPTTIQPTAGDLFDNLAKSPSTKDLLKAAFGKESPMVQLSPMGIAARTVRQSRIVPKAASWISKMITQEDESKQAQPQVMPWVNKGKTIDQLAQEYKDTQLSKEQNEKIYQKKKEMGWLGYPWSGTEGIANRNYQEAHSLEAYEHPWYQDQVMKDMKFDPINQRWYMENPAQIAYEPGSVYLDQNIVAPQAYDATGETVYVQNPATGEYEIQEEIPAYSEPIKIYPDLPPEQTTPIESKPIDPTTLLGGPKEPTALPSTSTSKSKSWWSGGGGGGYSSWWNSNVKSGYPMWFMDLIDWRI